MKAAISEHHLVVSKTARYCLLGELTADTTDLWIVCHGFGQLARDFIPAFEPIAVQGRAIVAPEALSRFYKSQGTVHTPATPVGATWMTSEDREHEIEDYVAYLDTLLSDLRGRMSPHGTVTVLGFSQGAATVSRWVARRRPVISRLILWGGLLPPELKDTARVGGLTSQPLAFVVGNTDRYFKPELVKSEFEQFEGLGIRASLSEFEGGHIIDTSVLQDLAKSGSGQ